METKYQNNIKIRKWSYLSWNSWYTSS